MTPLSKADKRDANTQYVNEVLGLQKAAMEQFSVFKDVTDIPRFNFHELVEDLSELYSKKDVNRYLLPSQAPQEQPPNNTKELMNFNYKDAGPFVKKQIEQLYDLQPDPTHDLALQVQAANLGAQHANLTTPIPTEGDPNGTGQATS
jgi:hypothetical protein